MLLLKTFLGVCETLLWNWKHIPSAHRCQLHFSQMMSRENAEQKCSLLTDACASDDFHFSITKLRSFSHAGFQASRKAKSETNDKQWL